MGLTYAQYVAELAELAVVPADDVNFVANLPSTIDYAELRIQRDLDFLATVQSDTKLFTANNRNLTLSAGAFVTVQNINVITPSTTTNPDLGTRNPLLPVTKELLDNLWPSSSGAGVPTMFAMLNDTDIIVGPWPLAAYTAEIVGTVRFDTLSASNTTNFISLYLPDLLLMASMIFISGFQRNFGRQSDDPAMAISYEQQYKALLTGATVEAFRAKFQSGGWTSLSPSPIASSSRG
jgi:hypothetical protein